MKSGGTHARERLQSWFPVGIRKKDKQGYILCFHCKRPARRQAWCRSGLKTPPRNLDFKTFYIFPRMNERETEEKKTHRKTDTEKQDRKLAYYIIYKKSKEACPFLCWELLYIHGQDFSDTQYLTENAGAGTAAMG